MIPQNINLGKLHSIGKCLVLIIVLSACHSTRKFSIEKPTNKNPLENISENLKNEVLPWMNVPYKLGGNTKSGIDCSGFVQIIYNKVYHNNIPRTSIKQFEQCKKVAFNKLKEGDLVFFKFNEKEVSHVGIFLYQSFFVHASVSKGVIVSSIKEKYYAEACIGGGKY